MTYLPKRTGYHDYRHIYEWMRAGVVTYDDYARMIEDDIAWMATSSGSPYSDEELHEADFNSAVFGTCRADYLAVMVSGPFFQRRGLPG